MELGLAIGIFIIVAIVLMTLFCVVTRYFNYKLRKALQEQNEIYSLIQGIQGDRQDINQGEYEDFVHKRIADKKKRQQQSSKTYKMMIEMTDMNEPLKQVDYNIYGISKLRKKLQNDGTVPLAPESQSRSIGTAKSFKPDRLSQLPDPHSQRSYLSKGSQQNMPSLASRKRGTANITIHKTVQKLVSYTEDGIKIVQSKAKQLWRQAENGDIKQLRQCKQTLITPPELGFEDHLDIYGFEKGIYGAYKFVGVYEIVSMKPQQVYNTRSLKRTEIKQQIQFPSFYIYKDKLENEGDLNSSKSKLVQ